MRTKAVNLFWAYYCSARFEMRNRLALCSETCHVLIGIASISIKCVLCKFFKYSRRPSSLLQLLHGMKHQLLVTKPPLSNESSNVFDHAHARIKNLKSRSNRRTTGAIFTANACRGLSL